MNKDSVLYKLVENKISASIVDGVTTYTLAGTVLALNLRLEVSATNFDDLLPKAQELYDSFIKLHNLGKQEAA